MTDLQPYSHEFPAHELGYAADAWQQSVAPPPAPSIVRRTLRNFTRVETFGYPYMGWVKGIIDTGSPALFRFQSHAWPPPRP